MAQTYSAEGVLTTRKDANRVYYRIGDPRTIKLVGMMREVLCSGYSPDGEAVTFPP